jgi:hypothetical protein
MVVRRKPCGFASSRRSPRYEGRGPSLVAYADRRGEPLRLGIVGVFRVKGQGAKGIYFYCSIVETFGSVDTWKIL